MGLRVVVNQLHIVAVGIRVLVHHHECRALDRTGCQRHAGFLRVAGLGERFTEQAIEPPLCRRLTHLLGVKIGCRDLDLGALADGGHGQVDPVDAGGGIVGQLAVGRRKQGGLLSAGEQNGV